VKFYDKAAERGLSDSWECIRCELELKRKRAHHAFEFLAQYGVRFAAGIIAAVIDFKEPSDLANKTRQPRAAWWDEVIESAKPVRLVVAKVVDSIERAYLWIERQVGPMLSALVDAAGGEFDVLRDIVDRSRFRQRPKHVRIVASACALLGGT
jgi:DNA relaxase NicK